MKWMKIGQLYQVQNDNSHLLTHAANPLPIHVIDDIYRIYYNGRDTDNKSSVSYVDIDILKCKAVYDHKKPILTPEPYTFYSHGISTGNTWNMNNQTYINFMGWNCPDNKHWYGEIGYCELHGNGLKNPKLLMGLNVEDSISLSYPHVMFDDGIYKMWYGSTISWKSQTNEMIHVIKYASSVDGLKWISHGLAIPYELGKAQAFSRPTVIKTNDIYHMWYSYRAGDGSLYKIGYSNSSDGITWSFPRADIEYSNVGWDSEMVCYPHVFEHANKIYMLYNGNNFGKTGFGIAILR